MALTQEQFSKLPKYAQKALQEQQIEIRKLREKLDRTLAAQKPSPFRINLGDGSDHEYGFIDVQTIEVVLDQKDGDIDLVNLVGPENKSLAARVRKIADGPNPWIPGAQADLIREIATELETLQKIREILNG